MKYLQSKSVFEHYLKSYKIFESLSKKEVREDLTEICYELTDGRFGIKIYDNNELTYLNLPSNEKPYVVDDKVLFIGLENRDPKGFSFDEVKDVILRVIDYLGDRYKGCSVLPVGNKHFNRVGITQHLRLFTPTWTKYNTTKTGIGNLINLIIIYK